MDFEVLQKFGCEVYCRSWAYLPGNLIGMDHLRPHSLFQRQERLPYQPSNGLHGYLTYFWVHTACRCELPIVRRTMCLL